MTHTENNNSHKNKTGAKNKQERQTRYLSQAIQLEEAVNPHIIRATMTIVSLVLLAFITWAGFTNINEIARTPGEIVPQGYQQSVQHLEGGMIKAIHVKENEPIQAGEIVVTMDDSAIKEDFQRAQARQIYLEKQTERLRAYIEGRELDVSGLEEAHEDSIADQQSFFDDMRSARLKEESIVKNQIQQKKQTIRTLQGDIQTAQKNLNIYKTLYQRRLQLHIKGFATDVQLLEDEQNMNAASGDISRLNNQIRVVRTEIKEFEGRLASLSASHRDNANERLDQILAEKAQNTELLEKLDERIGRLNIRAPVSGLVKGLAVNTIGGVIQPGDTIMEIVPLDQTLEVSVKISPQDIGHLEIGQPVQVKFSTFDFSRYGSVKGKLEQISATTFSGDSGERYYQGKVLLEKNYVGGNPKNVIMPGMTVMADVITGEKTILQYMLKPIHISLKTAFTER